MISPLDLEGNGGHGRSFPRCGQVPSRPARRFDVNPFKEPASDIDRGVFVRMALEPAVRIHAGEACLGGVGRHFGLRLLPHITPEDTFQLVTWPCSLWDRHIERRTLLAAFERL